MKEKNKRISLMLLVILIMLSNLVPTIALSADDIEYDEDGKGAFYKGIYNQHFDLVESFDDLFDASKFLFKNGHSDNFGGRLFNEDDSIMVEEVRTITVSGMPELEEKGYIGFTGAVIVKDSEGKYVVLIDTSLEDNKEESPEPGDLLEIELDTSMCLSVETLNNLDEVIGNSKYGFGEEDRTYLDRRPFKTQGGDFALPKGFHVENYWTGYRLINGESDGEYILCQLKGNRDDNNPDLVITRDNPEPFFDMLRGFKDETLSYYNMVDRENDPNWFTLTDTGSGVIIVHHNNQREPIISDGEMFGTTTKELRTYFSTFPANTIHIMEPDFQTEPNLSAKLKIEEDRIRESLEDPNVKNFIVHYEIWGTLEECVNKEEYSIDQLKCTIDQRRTHTYYVKVIEPEEEPEVIIPPTKSGLKPDPEPKPKLEPEPDPEPKPRPRRKIFYIIIIITIIGTVGVATSGAPFIPLFYNSRKLSIYSNLKVDGVIERKKVFSEPYQVNGTQLIVDITDTMEVKKQYNFLEIEIPKDIALSVKNKVIDNKKVQEIIPRVLVIKHKEADNPIQVSVISEDLYNEEKKLYVIRLNV